MMTMLIMFPLMMIMLVVMLAGDTRPRRAVGPHVIPKKGCFFFLHNWFPFSIAYIFEFSQYFYFRFSFMSDSI